MITFIFIYVLKGILNNVSILNGLSHTAIISLDGFEKGVIPERVLSDGLAFYE